MDASGKIYSKFILAKFKQHFKAPLYFKPQTTPPTIPLLAQFIQLTELLASQQTEA